MRPSISRFATVCALLVAFVAAASTALVAQGPAVHGVFEKPFWSFGKTNRATRGAGAGTQGSTLYMMQPREHATGARQSVGFAFTAQDEDASTSERCVLRYVRYAADGRSPDTSAQGTIASVQVDLFGRQSGARAREFRVSLGRQVTLPAQFGVAIDLASNARWPRDGASVHAQLNMPQDSRRPRIPAPHNKLTWAFEAADARSPASALGGRANDLLALTGQYTEAVLQLYVETTAYGLGTETLFGAEAYFPSAARGDRFGLVVDAGIGLSGSVAVVFVAPRRLAAPHRQRPPARRAALPRTRRALPRAVDRLEPRFDRDAQPALDPARAAARVRAAGVDAGRALRAKEQGPRDHRRRSAPRAVMRSAL